MMPHSFLEMTTPHEADFHVACKGFTQIHGEDFEETFAPILKLVTIIILLVICLQLDMKPMHMDAKATFLNATLFWNMPFTSNSPKV